ncbi:hypothetical protein VNO78_33284 [Psophocarpus tetragonolobus]|uniref:Uncharacterized protein n=1 Tax=Psophocarpus tetragonolobus TaxID=3891 RepID=A0AAN9RL74_PSOTE
MSFMVTTSDSGAPAEFWGLLAQRLSVCTPISLLQDNNSLCILQIPFLLLIGIAGNVVKKIDAQREGNGVWNIGIEC